MIGKRIMCTFQLDYDTTFEKGKSAYCLPFNSSHLPHKYYQTVASDLQLIFSYIVVTYN